MDYKFENFSMIICTICMMVLIIPIIMLTIHSLKPKYNVYDVNHDGKVNSLDLLKVQKYILEQNNNN